MSARNRETPGPVTWCGIIATTCLSLFLFQKILWLIVPFMLAISLHYLLAPLAKKIVLAGFSTSTVAALLSGAFLIVISSGMILLYPLAVANAENWQINMQNYFNGGGQAIESILRSLEKKFIFLAKADVADKVHTSLLEVGSQFSDKHISEAVITLAAWLPSLLLTPIIAYFMLKESGQLRKFIGSAVPNAYFEKTLYLMHALDNTARTYFLGLIKIAALDALIIASGLWALGLSSAWILGIIAGILGWIPYIGPLIGLSLAVMVTATDFPGNLNLIYWVFGLFALVRVLEDFVFMPFIIGKSLHIHPLLTLLMFFVGESIAGVPGLMLVVPILGIVMVIGETLEIILRDSRLKARHLYAAKLQHKLDHHDLTIE